MSKVKIYVEGVNDRVFFANYLETILGLQISISGSNKNIIFAFSDDELKGEIVLLKGWGQLNTTFVQNDIQANKEEGIKSIILLDADTPENDGSFAVRQAQVEEIKAINNLEFDYFLIPNNESDGCLETVLRVIVKSENQGILDCIDASDDCLRLAQKQIGKELNLYPLKDAEKSKFGYLRRLLKDEKDFKDNTIWDLESPYLEPLKLFLQQHLEK